MSKSTIRAFYHVLIGLAFILKGLERLQVEAWGTGVVLCIFGLVAIAYFVRTRTSAVPQPALEVLVYAFEGAASFITAYSLYEAGKRGLPIVFVVAGIGLFVASWMHLRSFRRTAMDTAAVASAATPGAVVPSNSGGHVS